MPKVPFPEPSLQKTFREGGKPLPVISMMRNFPEINYQADDINAPRDVYFDNGMICSEYYRSPQFFEIVNKALNQCDIMPEEERQRYREQILNHFKILPDGSYNMGISQKLELRIHHTFKKENFEATDPFLGCLLSTITNFLDFNYGSSSSGHHSLFGNKALLFAGTFIIKEGKVTAVYADSGHFAPKAWNLCS
jgi:hypothetical protein